ncbi:MAG: elongation factor G [Firmicutes bacterium ML8_F2]|jgi:elongation factor G|nr:MAG: elongation factor G [Firmicutes bacterium ML8_F2]
MKKYTSENIRNVALISHGGAGKTSLAEALLFTSGAINRLGKIESGNTTTDYDPDEIKKQVTINVGLAPLEWDGVKINLLDTPGYFDFIGDVLGALRVADSVITVVCAVSGVEVGTEKVWGYADGFNLPRFVVINKLDRENANFEGTLEQLRNHFGLNVVPIQMPIGKEASFKGVVDLISQNSLLFSEEGMKVSDEAIPAELEAAAGEMRERLIEAVAEADDSLLEKYLEGEGLNDEEIYSGLRQGVLDGKIIPVLCAAATKNFGSQPLLDIIKRFLPSPLDQKEVKGHIPGNEEEVTRKTSPDEPLSAFVFKTLADPYVGRINYFRVYSGSIKPDSQIYNSTKETVERFGQVFSMRGKNQLNMDEIVTGDIACVAKLQETATGDTLCDRSNLIVFPQLNFPEPVISFAVEPKTKGDEEKVSTGLSRFLEEDPTFKLERRAETKQTVISGLGELHLDIIVSRLAQKFGVDVDLSTPRIPYKETIRNQAKVEGKHKKQSGGRGQYGHVFLELEPAESGQGLIFEDKIFGGAVPRQYIPAVEKGVREAMEGGVVAGYPVVDVIVRLVDGSYHTVDSSEMAFKIAASQAFRKGMEQAGAILLEPIVDVEVIVPESFMGDIMGDLNSKRGRIQGMEPEGGLQKIRAQVPMSEMFKYSIDLRSMTQGRGFFTMSFSHYEEVPAQAADQVIATARAAREEESS